MNDDEIKNIVRDVNFRRISSLPPGLINSVYVGAPGETVVSPDRLSIDEFLSVDNYFYETSSIWGNDSEASFYFRKNNPLMIMHNVFVDERLRGRGMGKALLGLTEKVADLLGCEDRVYVQSVTNPEFWKHMGYYPVVFSGRDVYWSRVKP